MNTDFIQRVTTLLLTVLAVSAQASDHDWAAGDWSGTLSTGGQQLEIVYRIEHHGDALAGSMDVPAQGAAGLPLRSVTVDDKRLIIEMALAGDARFEGTRSDDSIEGTFSQAGQSFPMTLERAEAKAPPARPQEPGEDVPYEVQDVTFTGADGTRLAGTITKPRGAGPFPGVVLVSGAGPHDRDGSFMNHRPLLVLADHLTRAGFAVLRFDERGVGESEGEFASATAEALAGDISAGTQFLGQRDDLDSRRIGLITHSEGGRTASLVVGDDSEVDFLILLAAPARPGIESLRAQSAQTNNPTVLLQAAMADAALGAGDAAKVETAMRDAAQEVLADFEEQQLAAFGGQEAAVVDQLVQALGQPQARFTLHHDPRPAIRQAEIPVLAVYGDKDRQMNPDAAAGAWRAALGESADVETLPGLNHFLQPAETGAPSEYATIEQTLAPEVLARIVAWLESETMDAAEE